MLAKNLSNSDTYAVIFHSPHYLVIALALSMNVRSMSTNAFFPKMPYNAIYSWLTLRESEWTLQPYQHAYLRMGKRVATARVNAQRAGLWHANHPAPINLMRGR